MFFPRFEPGLFSVVSERPHPHADWATLVDNNAAQRSNPSSHRGSVIRELSW